MPVVAKQATNVHHDRGTMIQPASKRLHQRVANRFRRGAVPAFKEGLFGLATAVSILFAWQMVYSYWKPDQTLLPSPLSVFASFRHLVVSGDVLPDLKMTLARMGAGYALAAIIGVTIGLSMGAFRPVYQCTVGIVDFIRSVPISSLYPLFVLFLGISHASKIGMVFVATAPIIALNSAYGVRHSSKIRSEMAYLFGASRFRIFTWITFYESLPQTMVGLRVALSYTLVVEILCEMFMGSENGIGQRITDAYTTYAIDQMYALILFAGILGLLLNRTFNWIEKRLIPWASR